MLPKGRRHRSRWRGILTPAVQYIVYPFILIHIIFIFVSNGLNPSTFTTPTVSSPLLKRNHTTDRCLGSPKSCLLLQSWQVVRPLLIYMQRLPKSCLFPLRTPHLSKWMCLPSRKWSAIISQCMPPSLLLLITPMTPNRLKKQYWEHRTNLGKTGQGLVENGQEDEIQVGSELENIWGMCSTTIHCPPLSWSLLIYYRCHQSKVPWYSCMHALLGTSPIVDCSAVANSQTTVDLSVLEMRKKVCFISQPHYHGTNDTCTSGYHFSSLNYGNCLQSCVYKSTSFMKGLSYMCSVFLFLKKPMFFS